MTSISHIWMCFAGKGTMWRTDFSVKSVSIRTYGIRSLSNHEMPQHAIPRSVSMPTMCDSCCGSGLMPDSMAIKLKGSFAPLRVTWWHRVVGCSFPIQSSRNWQLGTRSPGSKVSTCCFVTCKISSVRGERKFHIVNTFQVVEMFTTGNLKHDVGLQGY